MPKAEAQSCTEKPAAGSMRRTFVERARRVRGRASLSVLAAWIARKPVSSSISYNFV